MSDAETKAIVSNCDQKRRASGLAHLAAAVAASREYGYLPRYGVYISCKVGRSCFLYCFHDLTALAGVQAGEAVGVADVKLGFWLKMVSNYPFLLSRTVAGKSQDGPELEVYTVLGEKCWPAIPCVTRSCCLVASVVARGADHYRCRLA